MTTTAFQVIFDKAESISINTRATVAQTISRSNVVRAVKRGGQVWRFEVKLPDGLPWDELRPYIAGIDTADRYTTGTVQINNSGYNSWMTPYQGNSANSTGFAASWTKGSNTITLTTSPTTTTGYKFKAGDFIQLNTGRCYVVAANVAYNSNTVTLNRPVLDTTGSGALKVGPACTWTVICTSIPSWNIAARNQVSWSGAFTFYESML